MGAKALITGFEPYGGLRLNPSANLAAALDGAEIGGLTVAGRCFPVSFAGLAERIEAMLAEVKPQLVIALGLYPGESVIRLERFGVNLADFAITDNAGTQVRDTPVEPGGPAALAATLPLRAIEGALLGAGIPARPSDSAGTYLCNAVLYRLLSAVNRRGTPIPCGFIHLPYLPEQVAELLAVAKAGGAAIPQTAIASMDFAVMERALRLAVATTAAQLS